MKPAASRAGIVRTLLAMRSAFLKVGILTLVGGGLPLFFGEAVPQRFSAETRLRVEAASDAAIDNAAAMLRSRSNLDNLVRALNLGRGSEFAVDRPSAVRVVSDIVSGEAMTMAQAESRLRERLSQAIAVTYDRTTRQVAISVSAARAEEAAQIAAMLGDTFRNEIAVLGAGAPQPVVEKLRQTLEHAEAALSGFMAETDGLKLAEMRRTGHDGQQRAADMAEAETRFAELKQMVALASAMKLVDVLAKPLPDSLEFTGLDYQRQRHVEAKLVVDQLSANLGPRHPKLQAAQAALDDVRNDIQEALKQLVTSLRQQESTAGKRLAELKAKQTAKPDDKEIVDSAARLGFLEATVEEARENYLQALHRSETETRGPAAKVGIVAAATPATTRQLGPSNVEIAGGGALIGFCLGLALAFFTRRRPQHAAMAQAEAEWPAGPQVIGEPDWAEDEEDDRTELEDMSFEEPDCGYSEPPFRQTYPQPANDSPLADHIRDMLMVDRRAERDNIPPLVAAIMGRRLAEEPSYAVPHHPLPSREEARRAEDLRELRRHMAELRERVEVYSASRSAGRR